MKQRKLLIETLKAYLKHRGITYREIAKKLGQSEANVKRVFSRETFSLEMLEDVCGIAGLELLELARMSRREKEAEQACFTRAQETSLAADPKLFALLYLLLSEVPFPKITSRFQYTAEDLDRYLLKLDRLGILELGAERRHRLLISKNIRWLPNGPLNTLYNQQIKNEFLDSDFSGQHERLRFLNAQLTASSMQALSRRIDRLIAEFVELAEIDKSAATEETRQIWFILAHRPWQFSIVSRYRRR